MGGRRHIFAGFFGTIVQAKPWKFVPWPRCAAIHKMQGYRHALKTLFSRNEERWWSFITENQSDAIPAVLKKSVALEQRAEECFFPCGDGCCETLIAARDAEAAACIVVNAIHEQEGRHLTFRGKRLLQQR